MTADIKSSFIELALAQNALRLGEFTLKSGRISPYFFNMGAFQTAKSLTLLGEFYASCLQQSGINYDMIFGPAYKGIPLVCATAQALYQKHQHDVPYSFDRKEAKDHGEGGRIVGAPLQGNVIIVDDVITAGTAFRSAHQLIEAEGAKVAGLVVALDRQERGQGDHSAIEEIKQRYQIPVVSIIGLNDILHFFTKQSPDSKTIEALRRYQTQYGSASSQVVS